MQIPDNDICKKQHTSNESKTVKNLRHWFLDNYFNFRQISFGTKVCFYSRPQLFFGWNSFGIHLVSGQIKRPAKIPKLCNFQNHIPSMFAMQLKLWRHSCKLFSGEVQGYIEKFDTYMFLKYNKILFYSELFCWEFVLKCRFHP